MTFAAVTALATALAITCPSFPWSSGDKILLVGDSITYKGVLSTFLAQAIDQRHPDLALDMLKPVGVSGATCASLKSPNWTNIIKDSNPTVVILECGINDSQLKAWTQAIQDGYINGIKALVAQVQTTYPAISLSKIVVLGPPPVDPLTYTTGTGHPVDATTLNSALSLYNTAFASTCSTMGWTCIDIYTPILSAYNLRAADSPPYTWWMTGNVGDGIHPTWPGGVPWAEAVLAGLGETTDVSEATLDVSSASATCTRCSVSNASYSTTNVTFDKLDTTVPQQWETTLSPSPSLAVPYVSGNAFAVRNATNITVTGLTSGTYSVTIDGVSFGSKTDTALAAGVDVSNSQAWHTPSQTNSANQRMISYTMTVAQTYLWPLPTTGGLWTQAEINSYAAGARLSDIEGLDAFVALPSGRQATVNSVVQPVSHHYIINRTGP